MPLVPDTPAADAHARPPLSTRGLKPFDINPDDMDEVTVRIFNELRKQLSMMEAKKAPELTTADRVSHARILASLERTMERLAQVEAGRAAARKSVKEQDDGNALLAIERRVVGAVAAELARCRAESAHGS